MTEVVQYNTREMLEAIKISTPPVTFLQDRLVKRTKEHATKTIEIDTQKGGQRLAAYVERVSDANVVSKPGFGTKIHTIPYTSELMVLTAEDLETRTPGETIYSSGSASSRRDQLLGEWLQELDERIVRTEEKQLADALTDGASTIAGDGFTYNIDYGRDAGNDVALLTTDRWSQSATRDIPQDFRNAANQMTSPGVTGGYPTVVIMGRAAGGYFMSDSAVQTRLDNRRMELGEISPILLSEQRATFLGTFRDAGINVDIYVYDGQYIDSSGSDAFYIDENDAIFINEALRCEKHYGMIYNLNSNFVGRRFPMNWISKNGKKSFLQLESSPLVAVHEPNSTYRLKVH